MKSIKVISGIIPIYTSDDEIPEEGDTNIVICEQMHTSKLLTDKGAVKPKDKKLFILEPHSPKSDIFSPDKSMKVTTPRKALPDIDVSPLEYQQVKVLNTEVDVPFEKYIRENNLTTQSNAPQISHSKPPLVRKEREDTGELKFNLRTLKNYDSAMILKNLQQHKPEAMMSKFR